MEFITKFENMTDQYNKQQTSPAKQLHNELKKSILMSAVSTVMVLRSVGDCEQESFVLGGWVYDYHSTLQSSKCKPYYTMKNLWETAPLT
jgi:hypothetical protein